MYALYMFANEVAIPSGLLGATCKSIWDHNYG